MKIVISYPPISNQKGYPTLGQNRQFQFFKEATYIYPVVPATAATLLNQAGHEVVWNDCIAQQWNYEKFLNFIKDEKPDLIAFETKTPVVKQHWEIINDVKNLHAEALTALMGDHVTALPEESFDNSKVDFIITGGDYDFLLLNLCNVLKKKNDLKLSNIDYQLSTELEAGIYFRQNGRIGSNGTFKLNHNLDELPFIDRDLTNWELYAYENGNYKRTPATYIMSGRDCWWGKCSFCSWPSLYPQFRVRTPDNVLDEIGQLIEKYKVREIMDDTGTFPIEDWLRNFCNGMIKHQYNKEIYLDCNMRFGTLSYDDFLLMKKANFRLLLFGLESANQNSLDRLNKNLKVERIIEDCQSATRAGLYPHITIMFGYPWESYEDALKTLKLGKWLLKKGYAHTMQATVVIPYPGTPLFEESKRESLLKTINWDDYDMRRPVIATSIPDIKIMELVQGMYKVSFSPEFILRKFFSVKDFDDVKYSFRAAKKITGHIFDFSGHKKRKQISY